MRKLVKIPILGLVLLVIILVSVNSSMGGVGQDALKLCKDFAFSLEEDFVTQGPTPPDGNPIISDGDLLGRCAVCARNDDLLLPFDVKEDLGLDAVDIIDVEQYLVAFSTEIDSPNRGQFTAGDLLVTNGAIIPNIALLERFGIIRADFGLDAVQFVGLLDDVIGFVTFAATVPREDWLLKPGLLTTELERYNIDILFSIEGTGPTPIRPGFLDGDLLSARYGIIVESNGTLLPIDVPAGIPDRGVDFGLDAVTTVEGATAQITYFSTEILFNGKLAFNDGDMLELGDGVIIPNIDLITCFEPMAGFLGLDAVFSAVQQGQMISLLSQLEKLAHDSSADSAGAYQSDILPAVDTEAYASVGLQLERCKEIAFSTEEDFVTQGPIPPDGNPIISDGDLLGKDCFICARNQDLLQVFDVTLDLGLDAVDIINAEKQLAVFSTELDSPNLGQFTAGDLLATNGAIIPNIALMFNFNIRYDIGLDAIHFVGPSDQIVAFLDEARTLGRDFFITNPDALSGMLRQWGIDIWFSTEGTGPLPDAPSLLDGDLLSAESGTIVVGNDILLPADVPAGIPLRGVDFGLDAVTGHRNGDRSLINFSTEILYSDTLNFTDGDILKLNNGVITTNQELISCFEPKADFLGLDALSKSCMPVLEWAWNTTTVEPEYDQVMMAPVAADLNDDSIPDIIFSTFSAAAGWQAGAILRAISGNGGAEIFSVTSPNYRVNAGAEPAVADIDNDGKPEIVASKDSGEVICFENDGTLKWISTANIGRIGLAIADLDQDGIPEIIGGRTVFNNDGSVRWTGTGGSNYVSVVANLDLVDEPEVVTGTTAYRYDGTVYWASAPGGRPAIGNFDEDPYPEIVVVGGDQVAMKEHDGTVKWGPVAMPGGGNGAPVVADVDGDGQPEIGVGGYDFYVVFEGDGSIKWTAPIQDHSSRAASSTAFDFDQDGSYEIVYSDELKLRIYNGNNGMVLFEATATSGTLTEHPIILDVDNDGHVEIVSPANNYPGFGVNTGIEVFGNDECWPNARKIWNQHTYHITNIYDDAYVPANEMNNWDVYNNFRAQSYTGLVKPITVSLLPDSTIIPRGGTLGYTVTAVNNTASIQTFQYWTDVTLPNGNKLPLIPPLTVTLGPSASRSAHLSHPIPIGAPLGTYTYNAFIGPYPTIWDHDHFDFTVTTSLKKEGAKDWGTTIDQGFGK